MILDEALATLPGTIVPEQLDQFRQRIDPVWIGEALAATGAATVRRRRLPAEQVVWLVVGMALLRNESIDRVVASLDLALPTAKGERAAKSGISQARERLGPEPLAHLFATTADAWAHASAARHRWRQLALYGVDGTTLRLPDTAENWAAFGGQPGNGDRPGSAYPTCRVVALMALRSHLVSAANFGRYSDGETTLAAGLWGDVPDDSLVVVDRAFVYPSILMPLATTGRNRHWLARPRANMKLTRTQALGKRDELVEVSLSDKVHREHPELAQTWVVRAIRYQRRGFPPSTLLTSLLDPMQYPADELVALYHERWELEVGYDEVKTHMLAREETIRSRTPDRVEQELWGIFIAYNLVRLEMERAADEAGVAPTRISFVNALSLVRYAFFSASLRPMAPGKIPKTLLNVRRDLKLLLLPARRERSSPREVKIKMTNYAKKKTPRRK
jgi:hypothetical protein